MRPGGRRAAERDACEIPDLIRGLAAAEGEAARTWGAALKDALVHGHSGLYFRTVEPTAPFPIELCRSERPEVFLIWNFTAAPRLGAAVGRGHHGVPNRAHRQSTDRIAAGGARVDGVFMTGSGLVFGRWALANTIAFTVGGAVCGSLLRSMQQPYYTVVSSAGEAARIEVWTVGTSTTIFGAIVGTAQWWVIRRHLRASWWLPATCLGWAVCGVGIGALSGVAGGSVSTIGPASVSPAVILAAAAAGVLCGLLLGTPQWLVLRRQVERAAWWPGLTLLGLVVGFGAGFLVVRLGLVDVVHVFRPEDFPSGKVLTLVGAVAGAGYAVVTGPPLARTFSRLGPASDAAVPASGGTR